MMTGRSVSFQNVTKRFSGRAIVDNVSFSLASGVQVALLGHNGAGKTTLLKLMLGFLKQDEGEINVFDTNNRDRGIRTETAFLPETPSFPKSLTGEEVLKFYLCLRGQKQSSADYFLELVGLAESRKQRVGTYSKGMIQRLGLAQALIGEPKLVILDEPTSGLDPIARQGVYELIDEVVSKGATVLLSSHVLTEVEASADRLLILSNGCLVADGTLEGLREKSKIPCKLKLKTKPGMAEKVANEFGVMEYGTQNVEVDYQPDQKFGLLSIIGKLDEFIEDFEFVSPCLSEIYGSYSKMSEKDRN